MKKILSLLFALVVMTTANAQLIKGDMNGDGQITMADANEVANTFLGVRVAEELPVYTKSQVDEMIAKLEARIEVLEKKDDNVPAGVEAVDLGLSVKWASCNLGAKEPEEYGDFFAWGETEGYSINEKSCSWLGYKWGTDSKSLNKYNTSLSYGRPVDNKSLLDMDDDAAHVNWGGTWRMPTEMEIYELCDENNSVWTWTTQNGVNGYKVTSKTNGNSIFLPAAGYRNDSTSSNRNNSLGTVGSAGNYWSGSLSRKPYRANYLYFDSSGVDFDINGRDRCLGLSVRAVCP